MVLKVGGDSRKLWNNRVSIFIERWQRVVRTLLATEMPRGGQKASGLGEPELASLRSQVNTRHREAFQTVRRLSDSDGFNYVMEEFVETIDELGELAMFSTQYREEVLNEPPDSINQ